MRGAFGTEPKVFARYGGLPPPPQNPPANPPTNTHTHTHTRPVLTGLGRAGEGVIPAAGGVVGG